MANAPLKSKALQHLSERRLVKDCSNLATLDQKLRGSQVTLYCGFDLTAESLHVGNLMTLMLAREFLRSSHKVIILLGCATTRIGDPTGKDETRKTLSDSEIEHNKNGILGSIIQILGTSNNNIQVLNNETWIGNYQYIDFLRDIGTHFTINRMMAMDSVKRRLDRESPMSFVEFNYMLMQAYDFYYLAKHHECLLQIGGSDQWGNIVNGIELSNRMQLGNEVFGLTCPLVTRSDGKKMGKSENGAIWLSKNMLPSYDYFQHFRNIPDNDVPNMLCYYTDLPYSEIQKLSKLSGKELNEAKQILAFEATKICRGENEAQKALEASLQVFENSSVSKDMPKVIMPLGSSITEACIQSGAVSSKSAAKTLIAQGAAKIDGNACDIHYTFTNKAEFKLSLGKKNHYLISIT